MSEKSCPSCYGKGENLVDCSSCGVGGIINVVCPECGDSADEIGRSVCTTCGGDGWYDEDCPNCGGKGEVWEDCDKCGGSGYIDE